MTGDEMWQMKLHETVSLGSDSDLTLLRVPGGWIYTSVIFDRHGCNLAVTSCFVPLNNEFHWGEKRS